MPTPNVSAYFEALFHSSSIDLVIPSISQLAHQPDPTDDSDRLAQWWTGVEGSRSRDVAFFGKACILMMAATAGLTELQPDEQLFYFVGLNLPHEALLGLPGTPAVSSTDPPSELLRFIARLQLTMSASFLPPLPPLQPPSTSSTSLAPPPSAQLHPPGTTKTTTDARLPPLTPNPFPAMAETEAQYAHVDGVVVWEGAVVEEGRSRHVVFRTESGWQVVWRGEVPVAYVRTQIPNPILSLTSSVTLRDQQHTRSHRKNLHSVDTASIRSGTTIQTLETDGYGSDDDFTLAGMKEIDLLGGLAGEEDELPSSRIAPSLRADLNLPVQPPSSPLPFSATTPAVQSAAPPTSLSISSGPSRERALLPSLVPSSHGSTTLRKSFRRILSLSSGLRVRMRTLFLPQLLPPRVEGEDEEDAENESERRIVLCVEIENTVQGGFSVEDLVVDVGGKGGKASTELLCRPEKDTPVFPIRLVSIEQYNLLYVVDIAVTAAPTSGDDIARSLGRGDDQRPVSIAVLGKPFLVSPDKTETFPTKMFDSKWNCNLDLTSFHASSAAHFQPPPPPAVPHLPKKLVQNAIAGDKRFSLASLVSSSDKDKERIPSGRPAQAPKNDRISSMRLQPQLQPQSQIDHHEGLLVSVKILSPPEGGIVPLKPFSIEVFVCNRSDEVRRFRLSVPMRDIEGVDKRRRRQDSAARQLAEAASALVPLENDIRCGPLLPGASLSARIRFMALREGVFEIERLRITDVADKFDFVMSPVLDVVVCNGESRS
ncbi:hypothetical protein P7C73_g4143, partial [Tremellales sp. Uapishka_1]